MIELKGPSFEKAYDSDGNPTKALQGFMRGNSFSEENLEKIETEKGTYIYGRKKATVEKTEKIKIISIKFFSRASFNKKGLL